MMGFAECSTHPTHLRRIAAVKRMSFFVPAIASEFARRRANQQISVQPLR
jgi:hypothetical protein